ncbi:MAG: hypothetical protein C4297_10405 [Gemmataceae bacterium]
MRNWLERHQHPANFYIHVLCGIPLTLLALPLFLWNYWLVGGLVFVLGYALQFLGHAIEGNDAGEIILLKRALGLPYVAVAPRGRA